AYDLQAWEQLYGPDPDHALASRSVVEGQATYAQFRVVYAMSGYDLRRVDLSSELDEFRERLFKSAHADASPYLASLTTFPYATGVGAAQHHWSPTGLHFAASQFDEPPLSTLQALSESYALELPDPEPLELSAPTLDADYTVIDESVLGAFMLELFLFKQGFSAELARSLALDWRADKLWIYSGPNERSAFLWEVQLRDDDFARLDLVDAPPPGVVREHSGSRLFVAGSDAPPEFVLAAGRRFLNDSP
ncbi:MAG TPA: hypothetical protein VEQ58_06250, partial [Polyangiaceae bacterium]|nr:hypothetical protein [Polyangiaceae bacterium]